MAFDLPGSHSGDATSTLHAFQAHAMSGQQTMEPTSMSDSNFDILEWHPAYQSCQRYFLDHAQYEQATQAVCALVNIRLPFQSLHSPITSSTPTQRAHAPGTTNGTNLSAVPHFVSPIPYIRRLVVTGFDKSAILHGFFGDDYAQGIMPHVECERRNYLFAAKHGGWRSCKKQYDQGSGGGPDESVPFMKPLDGAGMEELMAADKAWSSWLAMEDWMVGPRAPEDTSVDNTQIDPLVDGVINGNAMTDGMVDGFEPQ